MPLLFTATGVRPGRKRREILMIDVREAHSHALTEIKMFVQLPFEVRKRHPGTRWELNRCLRGARGAL